MRKTLVCAAVANMAVAENGIGTVFDLMKKQELWKDLDFWKNFLFAIQEEGATDMDACLETYNNFRSLKEAVEL